jgi:hypothetical protein
MADNLSLFTQLDAPEGEAGSAPTAPQESAPEEAPSTPPPTASAVDAPPAVAAAPLQAASVPEASKAPEAPKAVEAEKPDRSVPLAVLIEERKSHKEAIEALKAQVAELSAKFKPEALEVEPEFLDDPKGYVDRKVTAALKKIEALEKTGTEKIAGLERSAQDIALDRALEASQQAFVAKQPDFNDALTHVRKVRIEQLKLAHPEATEAQIIAAIATEERTGAAQLIAAKRDPVEFLYAYAKTIGYTPKVSAPQDLKPPALNGATVPADVTLTKTAGQAPGEQDESAEVDPLAAAKVERFTRKRA